MGLSVAVLVYFLNHIPASIRINSVLKGIGARLLDEIADRFPDPNRGEKAAVVAGGEPIRAHATGYIQAIAFARLERIAARENGMLKLAVRTGDFVHPLVTIAHWSDLDITADCPDAEVRECFTLGSSRTPSQDMLFLIDELVEIGLRALSPGINDPFTAVTAVHWLGAATAELGRRNLARSYAGEGEDPHLYVLDDDFDHFVARGFGALRSGLATNRIAALEAFNALIDAASTLDDETRRETILREGEALAQQANEHLVGPELELVGARYQRFLQALER